jgi:TctA family transporter
MLDGYPLTKQGHAGRALGASQMASMLGAIFGGVVLASLIPIARPIILTFGSPEIFMMAILGISFVSVLGRESAWPAVITAGLGMILALWASCRNRCYVIPEDLYFWEGIQVVPIFMAYSLYLED